jgi:hypothetical protein
MVYERVPLRRSRLGEAGAGEEGVEVGWARLIADLDAEDGGVAAEVGNHGGDLLLLVRKDRRLGPRLARNRSVRAPIAEDELHMSLIMADEVIMSVAAKAAEASLS